jgi:hypothetical protein
MITALDVLTWSWNRGRRHDPDADLELVAGVRRSRRDHFGHPSSCCRGSSHKRGAFAIAAVQVPTYWLGSYFGFSALCMLGLALRLISLRAAIHRMACSASPTG